MVAVMSVHHLVYYTIDQQWVEKMSPIIVTVAMPNT